MVDFIKEAEKIENEVIAWRRELHQYPELLLDLPKTTEFVMTHLKEMGYELFLKQKLKKSKLN